MPLFVDHAGINTLISDDLDLVTNTRTLNKRDALVRDVAINIPVGTSLGLTGTGGTLSGFPSSGNITISFWINVGPKQLSGDKYIFSSGISGGGEAFRIRFNSGEFSFVAFDNGSNSKEWIYNTLLAAPITDSWHHMYIVWNGNFANDPIVFLDNVAYGVSSRTGTGSGTNWNPSTTLAIGGHHTATSNQLGGALYSFGIWNVSSSANADALYNAGKPLNHGLPSAGNLLLFYQLGNESTEQGTIPSNSHDFATMNVLDFIEPFTLPNARIHPTSGSISYDLKGTDVMTLVAGPDHNQVLDKLADKFVGRLSYPKQLAGITTHRNGPYGMSTWKQLRASENPIIRNHKKNNNMTFVIQPGPIRNLLADGELRVRDRYSALYSYTEPCTTEKAYPLVWNVGRHFRDEEGNIDYENPHRFSILSSYGNEQIAFANDKVSKLHNFDPDEEETEYVAIKDMYLSNGLNKLDSPLSHWEFIQYRETIFPKAVDQYVNRPKTRPNFENFYRHAREDRGRILDLSSSSKNFGFPTGYNNPLQTITVSSWPLDPDLSFLAGSKDGTGTTANNAGILLNSNANFSSILVSFGTGLNSATPSHVQNLVEKVDSILAPYPIYARNNSLFTSQSVSNPSGMLIHGTSSTLVNLEGNAFWDAGACRQVLNAEGEYISSPKAPFL